MQSPMEIRIESLTLTPDEQRAKDQDSFNSRQSADLLHLKSSPFPGASPIDPRKTNYNAEADMEPEERERREADSKNENIAMSSYLEKKKDSGGNWKKRWMVLYKGGPIYFYDSAKDEEPSGVIYLVNATLFEKIQLNGFVNESSFGIRVDGKDFLLRAQSEEMKARWCAAVDENMTTMVVKEKNGTKSSNKKSKNPASGSFYKNGEELDAEELKQQPYENEDNEENDEEGSSDSEDESGTEDESEDEEGNIDDTEVILEDGIEILKDSKRNIWTKRHAIIDNNGEMFIYRESSNYPCDLIKLKETSVYSRVENHGKEMAGAFNLQYAGKNNICRPCGEKTKQHWLETIKNFSTQEVKKHAPHLSDLAHLKDQGKKMSFFEVEDSLSNE